MQGGYARGRLSMAILRVHGEHLFGISYLTNVELFLSTQLTLYTCTAARSGVDRHLVEFTYLPAGII